MVNFAREVFVSVCPTRVPEKVADAGEMASKLQFRKGTEADLERLDPEEHKSEYLEQAKSRFADHHWLLGEVEGEIVTYTWLHQKGRESYRFLPGCEIAIGDSCGYGYDAWTPPKYRGKGLRRVAFLEELNILKSWGLQYEASFFVKHQLEGATRSLGSVGIEVIPVWRVTVNRDRSLSAELLNDDLKDVVKPTFVEA